MTRARSALAIWPRGGERGRPGVVVPPMASDPRYETLDAWRGVACLMVVLHHSGFALGWGEAEGDPIRWWLVGLLRQMDLGVPLFFVISGYCIAASLEGHRRKGASSWSFIGRRVRRIYPPYWVALLAFVATTWGLDRLGLHRLHAGHHSLELDSPGMLGPAQWLGNATLTETWRPRAWGGPPASVFTRVGWSLCFEEQFYLACFLTLLAAPRRLFAALGALTAAVVGYRAFAYDSGGLRYIEGTLPYLWHEFAVGLAVYWRLVRATSPRAMLAVEATLAGLMLVGLASGSRSTWVAAAFGLALIGLRRADRTAVRLPGMGTLRACGRRSYSIYLIHLPACTVGNEWLFGLGIVGFWPRALVMIPVVSTAAVGAGWLFFELVESRFLNPPSDGRPPDRAVAGGPDAPRGVEEAPTPGG